ncbi:MAG: hypothetical protein LBL46_03325, partial [Rickettsiales bacterium]|nr:hypothetical protein [Rickettsiales bacterium]
GTGERKYENGVWGPCHPIDCAANFHIEGSLCAADERDCTIPNGTGIQYWNGSKWGDCEAASCAAGYTKDRGLTNDWTTPCGKCRNETGVSGWSSRPGDEECTINFCLNQGEQYALIDNECQLICVEGRKDETTLDIGMHWNPASKKCELNCDTAAGFEPWPAP